MTNKSTKDREIAATRVFDAPRELVFQMFTDPKHVVHWWGPNGFTNTIHEMDVRPGGVWHFIMHGPDGVDYPNRITFLEIVKPERLVYDHGEKGQPGFFHVTVIFEDQGGKTKLSMRGVFESAAERDQVIEKYNAVEGMQQTLERLKEYLTKVQGE